MIASILLSNTGVGALTLFWIGDFIGVHDEARECRLLKLVPSHERDRRRPLQLRLQPRLRRSRYRSSSSLLRDKYRYSSKSLTRPSVIHRHSHSIRDLSVWVGFLSSDSFGADDHAICFSFIQYRCGNFIVSVQPVREAGLTRIRSATAGKSERGMQWTCFHTI